MSAIIISVMALIFSSSSRRCGNVRKRSCLRNCGKRCLRAVGKPAAFPLGLEYPFSTSEAAVFHISMAQYGMQVPLPHCIFALDRIY